MEDKTQDVNSLEDLLKAANDFRKWAIDFGDRLAKLLADIQTSKKEDTWEMKCPYENNDDIYTLSNDGEVKKNYWSYFDYDRERFEQGNIFPTKEAAELEAKRRNLLARFRALRDECNGDWKPDWDNHLENKYYIGFGLKGFGVCSTALKKVFPIFGYFMFKKDAQRAIELFGDEIKELFVEKRLANENN